MNIISTGIMLKIYRDFILWVCTAFEICKIESVYSDQMFVKCFFFFGLVWFGFVLHSVDLFLNCWKFTYVNLSLKSY